MERFRGLLRWVELGIKRENGAEKLELEKGRGKGRYRGKPFPEDGRPKRGTLIEKRHKIGKRRPEGKEGLPVAGHGWE